MRPIRRRRRPSEAGIAMVISLFTLMVLIVVCATSTLIAGSDIRATRVARGGSQAHLVAESGISVSLQLINSPRVLDLPHYMVEKGAASWGYVSHTFRSGSCASVSLT